MYGTNVAHKQTSSHGRPGTEKKRNSVTFRAGTWGGKGLSALCIAEEMEALSFDVLCLNLFYDLGKYSNLWLVTSGYSFNQRGHS